MFLRQAVGQRVPGVAARAAAVDAQLALGRVVLRIALDRHDVDGVRLVRMHRHRETEIAGQIAADFEPRVAGIVAAHHVPVLLHEERLGPRRMHRDAVHAVADFGLRVGDVLRMQAAVDGPPRSRRRRRCGTRRPPRSRRTSAPGSPGRAGWCAGTCRRRPASISRPAVRAAPGSSCQVCPPSVERNSAASSTPA